MNNNKKNNLQEIKEIKESWKNKNEIIINKNLNFNMLSETIPLKMNNKILYEKIRSIIPSETIVMHEPCINDFFINNESSGEVENISILEDWLIYIDCLLEKAENEKGLEIEDSDISHLFVRKSTILCTLGFFETSKDFAQQSIDILETSIGYYRLAIAQYCLKEYDLALETLLKANDLDGLNLYIQHALQVVLTRIRSRKDRPDILDDEFL